MRAGASTLSAPRGAAALTLAAALWGSSFVVTKTILPDMPAAWINFCRFALAALALAPFLRRDLVLWRAGSELGLWLLICYGSQTIGLRYTSVNRSAFITSMNVIFVPILAACLGRRIRPLIWAAALAAIVGCGLLSHDGGNPNRGDLWTVLAALSAAAYILRMEVLSGAFATLSLTAVQMIFMAGLSAVWAGAAAGPIRHMHWPAVIYLALACTAATTWMQTLGQRVVPAVQAALIFMLEPVFAALFGYLILHESLGIQGLGGAALIILAAVVSQLPPKESPPRRAFEMQMQPQRHRDAETNAEKT